MFTDPQKHPSEQNKNERKREEKGRGKERYREASDRATRTLLLAHNKQASKKKEQRAKTRHGA
jgi:hypothetical protein